MPKLIDGAMKTAHESDYYLLTKPPQQTITNISQNKIEILKANKNLLI